jgi:alpha-amylase
MPGFVSDGMGGNLGSGAGVYEQHLDTTQLAEGRHYITVRAFRHSPAVGTPIFNDFRRVIYVDRLPPESEIVSFAPFASSPSNPNNRDLVVRSVDQTADNVHVLLNLPANLSEAEILALAQGSTQAGYYDRDQFVRGITGVSTGNHVATVVTFEPTGNFNIQRFAGLYTQTNIGVGFGDLNASGSFTVSDIRGAGNHSVEDVLYSQNDKFRAAFDVNGDGLGDNRDLFLLDNELVGAGAGQAVLDAYTDLLLTRGDVDSSGSTDADDVAALASYFGTWSWLMDMNVDGAVNIADVSTMITEVFRTAPGDFNLDGRVGAADYTVWRDSLGLSSGALYTHGDGNFDGRIDAEDYQVWRSAFGFVRKPLSAGAGIASAIPEPATLSLAVLAVALLAMKRKRQMRTGMVSTEYASTAYPSTDCLYPNTL